MSEGGNPQFRIERNKAPTGVDQREIRAMHSALTPHTTIERILAGAGTDNSLDQLHEMDGVFEAKDESGKAIAALTVVRSDAGWEIRHLQADTHDEGVLAALIDAALEFAKARGGAEIRISVSERTDMLPILRARDFEEIETGDVRTYRRHL